MYLIQEVTEAPPVSRSDLVRAIRGQVFKCRLKVIRLEHAWPNPEPEQRTLIRQARRELADAYKWARREKVKPFRKFIPTLPPIGADGKPIRVYSTVVPRETV